MIAPAWQIELDPDADLMLRTKHGDTEAFVQLFKKHYQPTVRMVSFLMGNQTHSEDLSQLVFLKVYEARTRYVASAKFTTWLSVIVHNVVLSKKRNLSRQQKLLRRMQQGEDESRNPRKQTHTLDPSAIALRSEARRQVSDLICQLNRNQRRAIQLVYLRGQSYRQAASTMGVTLTSLKLLLHRAKSNLRNTVMVNPAKYALSESEIHIAHFLMPNSTL